MIASPFRSSLAYGGDYNPEQWPESTWTEDMRLMREAGVNLVSLGVFAWAWLQPTERRYDFRRLDRIMDLLSAHGIRACLATATASPPAWLAARHPDVLAVDADGRPCHHGSRQYYSPCSPSYRRFAAALVRRLADRYARHPALACWHINNEYGNHIQECHSPAAARAFRAWLKRKYGSLAALNAAWGTLFWSQAYSAWSEVSTPLRTAFTPNPTQQLDFRRFMSEALRGLLAMEIAIVRAANPAIPVTTNLMGFHKPVDGFRWARDLDLVSWNSYPDPRPGAQGEIAGAAGHDLTRSLRKDRPFFLMEQAAAWVNWPPSTATKPPGLLRLWTLQAIARGADAAMFFQWRASRYGAEKFMSGMVPHIPAEQSRIFAEVKRAGADLAALAPVTGSRIRSHVAIVFDWDAWWAVELEAKPARFDYVEAVRSVHRYFYERNIAVDFVHPSEALDGYRLVVAPMLYLLGAADAARLTSFARDGGTLVVSCFSGIVDENDHIVLGGYPARLREALGLWVEEWSPCMPGQTNRVRFTGARRAAVACRQWCEVLRLEGAKPLAAFERDFFAGRAAVARHAFGRGTAFYLGTTFADDGLALVLDRACRDAAVAPVLAAPAGIEITLREKDGARFLFVLNHRTEPVRVPLAGHRGRDLLAGRDFRRAAATLGPREVLVLQLAPVSRSAPS
jgi:beta-galactosidase